ncbi:dipeptide ABC transporter, substrate-binding protein [Escherichia coli]|nr:dipeptide ABC transporter, substrate-binding protein [Escherichia coli]
MKVRQALTYAVNKDAIIKAVYQGAGVQRKPDPANMWGYNDDVRITPTILKKRKPC